VTTFITCWAIGWVITVVHELLFTEDVKKFSTPLTVLVMLVNIVIWPFIAWVAILRLTMHPDDVKWVDEQVKKEKDDERE
jgi:hypothetical protein